MKKKNIRNRKDVLSSKCFSCQLKLDFDIPTIKTENLKIQKSSLESLLFGIKKTMLAILSHSEKSKNEYIKSILKELSDDLKHMLKEKKSDNDILENENSKIKKNIQNKLFIKKESEQVEANNNINNKNININININNLNSEIFSLKTLNFFAENYIDHIHSLIYKKNSDNNYLQLCTQYSTIEEKEIDCIGQKYYPFVTKLLHKKIFDIRKKFKSIVSAKQTQNEEIDTTEQNLNQLKNFISKKQNGYMDNKDIIQEESKEFTQSITLTKMNNINYLINLYNKNKQTENEYEDNIIIIGNDDEDDGSFNSNNFSDSGKKKKNKDIKTNNINNNIKQLINLNMNINFNLNFDKLYPDIENIMHNSERNNDDIINLLNKNKKKKGLSSTGSLPYLLLNSIKEDSMEMSMNETKNKINDKNSICKNNNSKEILNRDYLVTD